MNIKVEEVPGEDSGKKTMLSRTVLTEPGYTEDADHVNKKARLWGKHAIERESNVLGDADPSSVLPADFIIPFENIYGDKAPPAIKIELKALNLWAPVESVHTTPTEDCGATPMTDVSRPPEIRTYPAAVAFTVTDIESGDTREHTYSLAKDINFVTAHPCVPSQHVKIMKSPSSPTIRQVDLTGNSLAGKTASVVGKSTIIFCFISGLLALFAVSRLGFLVPL